VPMLKKVYCCTCSSLWAFVAWYNVN